MAKYTIEVSRKAYNGVTANAKDQFEALHIAGRTGLITVLKEKKADMTMVALLLQIPFKDVQRLIELLVGNYVTTSDKVPVAENLFKDNIQDYYLLVCLVIKENLGNFWKLRRPEDASQAEQTS